jgi:thioredoxin 1
LGLGIFGGQANKSWKSLLITNYLLIFAPSIIKTERKIKMEVEITTENFESYKNGELPLVVDLWATWCGPCRKIGPIISELAKEYDGKLVVGKCNIEDNDDIAMEFGVRSIPTILFFKGGQLVDKFVGAAAKDVFDEKFKALL